MYKHVVMTLLAVAGGASLWSCAVGQTEQAPRPSLAAEDPAVAAAVQRARALLAERLQVRPEDISVVRTEPATWNDTGLGCAAPGTLAMQVITHGHVVVLSAQGRTHRVHVAGEMALICERPVLTRDELRRPRHARGLDVAIENARADLAQRLGIDAAQIRVAGMQPTTWEDNTLGCPESGGETVKGRVDGYRLSLQAGSRSYTYHTDLEQVRPCPPIESR